MNLREQAIAAYQANVDRLDDLITVVLNHTNDDTGLNVILGDYPVVWEALIDSVEPDDEDDLAQQAKYAYEEIIRDYAARIPMQRDEDGYVDVTQAWELAERIYSTVYNADDRRHRSQMLIEITRWIREGDWREDQIPDVETLAAEWREYELGVINDSTYDAALMAEGSGADAPDA